MNEECCAKCGAPKSDHPYRHPFQSTTLAEARKKALRDAAEVAYRYDSEVAAAILDMIDDHD